MQLHNRIWKLLQKLFQPIMHKYTCCLHALAVPAKEPLKDKLFLLPNLEIHTYFVFEKKGQEQNIE